MWSKNVLHIHLSECSGNNGLILAFPPLSSAVADFAILCAFLSILMGSWEELYWDIGFSGFQRFFDYAPGLAMVMYVNKTSFMKLN